MIIMKNDYESIAYSIRILCYEEKFKEARKIYEDSVRYGKLPQLYFDESRYTSASMPKWMCVTWDGEVTDIDKINCLVTVQQYFLEFMQTGMMNNIEKNDNRRN